MNPKDNSSHETMSNSGNYEIASTPSSESNRESSRHRKKPRESANSPPIDSPKGNDTPVTKQGCTTGGGASSNKVRISQQDILGLLNKLTTRDLNILTAIRTCKYLSSGQVRRLFFTDSVSSLSAARCTNRNLNRLKDLKLIATFKQKIGGRNGGSSALIWHLTEPGMRLLQIHETGERSRKRLLEPSSAHLKHTVAISECYVRLLELSRIESTLNIRQILLEPVCWRPFEYYGKRIFLKPDLSAVIENGEYEDRWFIEIDLSTEDLRVIGNKCKRYYCYYCSKTEQRQTGVFPFVLWITPDEHRRKNLIRCIKGQEKHIPVRLFVVITSEQLEELIKSGPQNEDLY